MVYLGETGTRGRFRVTPPSLDLAARYYSYMFERLRARGKVELKSRYAGTEPETDGPLHDLRLASQGRVDQPHLDLHMPR